MKLSMIAILFLLAGNGLAQPYDLKGDQLGMSLEEFLDRHELCASHFRPGLVGAHWCYLNTTVAGQECTIGYYFNVGVGAENLEQNGLFLIEVQMDGFDMPFPISTNFLAASAIRTALEAAYGPPHGKRQTTESADEVRSLTAPADSWVRANSEIVFANSADKVFELKYVYWPMWEEHRRRQKQGLIDDL